jgi:hypothetical protein
MFFYHFLYEKGTKLGNIVYLLNETISSLPQSRETIPLIKLRLCSGGYDVFGQIFLAILKLASLSL